MIYAVNESHFFNFETRMRISPIQSRTSRRDENFLTVDLRLCDEIEKNSSSISIIETRSRFIIFILRLPDENENFLTLDLRLRDEIEKNSSSISGMETRSRFIIFILRLRDKKKWSWLSREFPGSRILVERCHKVLHLTLHPSLIPTPGLERSSCIPHKLLVNFEHFVSL